MNNFVYEEPLIIREGMNICYPQILRTRKEIHKEARDLIRVEKTVNIEVARDGVRAEGLRCGEYFSTINTGRHSRTRINLSIEDLHWPTLVRKTNKLHITVSEPWRIGATIYQGARLPLRSMLAGEGLKVVNNVLYSLASFLCRYGLVSLITIDLSSMPPGLQPWETVLYPIRCLHQVQHIDIQGAPESTMKQAVASARTIGPRNLVWGRFAELYERARICGVLAEHNPILMDAVRPTARTPPPSSQSVFGPGGLIVGCNRSARRVRNLFRGSLQFFDKKWESGARKQMRSFLNDDSPHRFLQLLMTSVSKKGRVVGSEQGSKGRSRQDPPDRMLDHATSVGSRCGCAPLPQHLPSRDIALHISKRCEVFKEDYCTESRPTLTRDLAVRNSRARSCRKHYSNIAPST